MDGNQMRFLHMDEDWMHRIYLAAPDGSIISRSSNAFFFREDARAALEAMMQTDFILAEAA